MKRWFILLLLLSPLLAAQEPAAPPPPAAPAGDLPEAVVPQDVYDAGEVLKGKKVEFAFKVKNSGKAELSILSAKAG
jgi:hypothetical protein